MINLEQLITLSGSKESASYLEKMAIGYINSLLGYNIEDHENIFEADCLNTEEYLPQRPITSITKIEENTGDNFEPVWEAIDPTDYRSVGTAGKVISRNYIGRPIKITYRTGFTPFILGDITADPVVADIESTCPPEIEQAINILAKFFHNSNSAIGKNDIKSETVDGDKIEFNKATDPGMDQQLKTLLSKFYRYDVVT